MSAKVAFLCPLRPVASGVSDYSEELLGALFAKLDIDVYTDPRAVRRALGMGWRAFPYADFLARGHANCDIAVYQMGNSPVHAEIYRALLNYPGVTVLHDWVLHHLIAATTLDAGDPLDYVREMAYCHGEEGAALARRALQSGERPDFFKYPLVKRAVDASLGIIVHNQYMAGLARAACPDVPVQKVNHHFYPLPVGIPTKAAARRILGLPADRFLIVTAGFLTPPKRIEQCVRAFRGLLATNEAALYAFVGAPSPDLQLEQLLSQCEVTANTLAVGSVSMDAFYAWLAAADVVVGLRYPTAGETSGTVIRALGVGRPVIVSSVGAFADLPSDFALKVEVGPGEVGTLRSHLVRLASDPALCERMGALARAYTVAEHGLQKSAETYARFILETAARRLTGPSARMVTVLGQALAGMGLGEGCEPMLPGLARTVNELSG